MKLTQKQRILKLLRDKKTVTNYELNEIGFRYGARLADLRSDGYVITSQHIKDSLWHFTLEGSV
jgi:hypothetical protein